MFSPICSCSFQVSVLMLNNSVIVKFSFWLTGFIYDLVEDTEQNWEGVLELLCENFDSKSNDCFDLTKCMTKDYCSMRKNGKWGILDNKGEVVIDFKYDHEIDMVYNELDQTYYIINLDGQEGLLHSKSNVIIEPKFDRIIKSGDKYWLCEIDGKYLLKDCNGKILFKKRYDSIRAYNEYF